MKLEKITKEILNELNIKINLKGYRYWVEAVKYVIENNKTSYSMTKEIYTYLADKHNDTGHRVERALRHTIQDKQEEMQNILEYHTRLIIQHC